MMKYISFPGYGPNAPKKTINLKLVCMWAGADCNGNSGTEVYLVGVDKPVWLGISEWDFLAIMERVTENE